MTTQTARTKVKQQTIELVVIRADGTVENLGVHSYHHRNPLKRLAWRIGRWLRPHKVTSEKPAWLEEYERRMSDEV